MPITLPATDPADLYYRPLSNGRIILIENSSSTLSTVLTRRYAKRRRIPRANIVSVAMGTGATYTPATNTALRAALTTPVRTLMDSIGAQAVLLGPGCPETVEVYGKYNGASPIDYATSGSVNLARFAAYTRDIDNQLVTYGILALGWIPSGNGDPTPIYYHALPTAAYTEFIKGFADYNLGHGTTPATPDTLWITTYTGLATESIYLPTQTAIDALGATTNKAVIGGAIGINWGTAAYSQTGVMPGADWAESWDNTGKIVENALRYGEGLNPANRYQHPIHFQFDTHLADHRSLAYLHSQLVAWGYVSSYVYRVTGDSQMEPYAPFAGSAYSKADLDAGRVGNRPYHVMVGDASNLEMLNSPYTEAWQPTGGGASYMGPSEGWQYAVNGLRRGGVAGLTNTLHVTTAIYPIMYAIVHNLLRGMSWAESMYYATTDTPIVTPAFGDPLARPFPA